MKVHVLGGPTFHPELLLFPGGEPHCTIDPNLVAGERVWVECPFTGMVDFGYFLTVVDAIKRCHPARLGLYIPYFPGARQDHPIPGTPYTLGIFTDIVNDLRASVVVVVDPHSPAVPACVYNCEQITPAAILGSGLPPLRYNGLICPDAGATQRVRAVARALGDLPILHGHKLRDGATGKLSGFKVAPPSVMGRYLVVDDICDGGGTFIGLAQAFRDTGLLAESCILDLYVTHGIFSKGFTYLSKHYEEIITTDAYPLVMDTACIPQHATILPLAQHVQSLMERRLS